MNKTLQRVLVLVFLFGVSVALYLGDSADAIPYLWAGFFVSLFLRSVRY